MNIFGTRVYDLEEAIYSCRFPMMTDVSPENFDKLTREDITKPSAAFKKYIDRAVALAKAPTNSGHCSFLKLVLVSANFDAPIKWWEEAQRYTHFHLGSSMSTMHRASKFDVHSALDNEVDPRAAELYDQLIRDYSEGKISHSTLVKSIPTGTMLCCRCTTNYLQLRTMISQRSTHRLSEWSNTFMRWVRSLPMSKELITVELDNEDINKEAKRSQHR